MSNEVNETVCTDPTFRPLVEMTEEQEYAAHTAAALPASPTHPEKRVVYRALSRQVLCVAHVWPGAGDWRCYIDGVPGISHEREYVEVLKRGDQVLENVARALFPRFDALTYWQY